MTVFPQSALLEALGWTLVNSWWQFGILWILWLFVQKVWPRASSASRYNLAVCFLLTGTGWAMIGFTGRYLNLSTGTQAMGSSPAGNLADWFVLQELPSLVFPLLSISYLGWLSYKLTLLFIQLRSIRSLANSGLQKVPVQWRIFTEAMSAQMNLARKVQVWLSDKIDSPQIMGTLKPIILLPASAISHLSPDQLEAILIHELAHIKRNDYIWNWIVLLIETIFFFNVFVKLFISAIREEREHACDDWVLQFPFQPSHYAKALLTLEKGRSGREDGLVLAAGGSSRKMLLTRVRRILSLPEPEQKHRFPAAQIGGYLMAAFILTASLTANHLSSSQPSGDSLTAGNDFRLSEGITSQWFNSDVDEQNWKQDFPAWTESREPEERGNLYPKYSADNKRQELDIQISTRETDESQPDLINLNLRMVNQADEEENPGINIVQAVDAQQVEARAFTFEKADSKDIPEEAATIYLHPYVPKRSFEFMPVSPDTVKALGNQLAKVKATEEAVIETRIALSKINWEELGELIAAAQGNAKLEEVLVNELANLDWQEIRKEAKDLMKELETAIPDSLRRQILAMQEKKMAVRQQALELRQKALDLRQKQIQARKKQKIVHL